MKKPLRAIAWIIVLSAVVVWAATGANRGWTRTLVEKRTLDEVTGIEGITQEKRFQPGIDFLGAAFGIAVVLAGASLFIRKQPRATRKPAESPLITP